MEEAFDGVLKCFTTVLYMKSSKLMYTIFQFKTKITVKN